MRAHHSIMPSTHQLSERPASAPFERHCAFCPLLTDLLKGTIRFETNWLGDMSHNLAKVEVASSSLVSDVIQVRAEAKEI